MPVFKRSELTADILKQWQRETATEVILETASSIFDLSMSIAEKTAGKVDMREDGEVWVDGWPYSCWKKQGDMFVEYMPGNVTGNLTGNLTGNGAKIIRGPWN